MMMTERGMVAPAVGGSVLAQFDGILTAAAPELAGRVRAVAFDVETGRLDVVPDAPARGTQLRWSAPKLIAAAKRDGVRRERPRPARPGARTGEGRPRHGRRTGPAAGRARRAGAAADSAGGLPPGPRSAPPGRAAVPGRPGHRGGGGAAEPGDARAQAPGVPRDRHRPGRCASPDRGGPRPAPPPGHGHRGRRPAPGRAERAAQENGTTALLPQSVPLRTTA